MFADILGEEGSSREIEEKMARKLKKKQAAEEAERLSKLGFGTRDTDLDIEPSLNMGMYV